MNKTIELHRKLIEAYTVDNLNRICLILITWYKNQQFTTLKKVAEIISDSIQIEIGDNGAGFSKLMMLYHPDRMAYHVNEINRLTTQAQYDKLLDYSHILLLDRLEELSDAFDGYEDIDYSPVYEWDFEEEGFRIIDFNSYEERKSARIMNCTFYEAVKNRIFGNDSYDFPFYYLEDMEELELSGSGIDDLEGAQYCIHSRIMDLSDNYIYDLEPLYGLLSLEELDLSCNRIEDVDIIGYLKSLKRIILTNNRIQDISALFNLERLEYVDLTGNMISISQINRLKVKNVEVEF